MGEVAEEVGINMQTRIVGNISVNKREDKKHDAGAEYQTERRALSYRNLSSKPFNPHTTLTNSHQRQGHSRDTVDVGTCTIHLCIGANIGRHLVP